MERALRNHFRDIDVTVTIERGYATCAAADVYRQIIETVAADRMPAWDAVDVAFFVIVAAAEHPGISDDDPDVNSMYREVELMLSRWRLHIGGDEPDGANVVMGANSVFNYLASVRARLKSRGDDSLFETLGLVVFAAASLFEHSAADS